MAAVLAPKHPVIPRQLDGDIELADSRWEVDQAHVVGTDFAGAVAISISVSKMENCDAMGMTVELFELSDVECVRFEAAALQAYKANLLRVALTDCRLTGVELAEGHFEDCVFKNVKFDNAGFRFATFKRVRFENCILRQADFSSAKFSHVTFTDCDLEAANFASAHCTTVDVTNQDLSLAKGILGLKGATISTEQLIQLAPLLASELGFHIEDTA
jgi:uncharacterized protein YjbI with pentapeptide repeats